MPTKKSNGEPGGASEAQEQRVREQQLIERAVTELVKDKKFQITATTLKKLSRGRGRGKEAIAPIDVSGFDWSELVREINRRSRGVEPKNGNRDVDAVASVEGVKPDESKPPKEGGNLEKISKEIDGLAKRIERGKSKADELLISLDKLEEAIHRDASSDDKLLKRIVELRQRLIKAEEQVAEVVDDTVEYSGGFPFGKDEPLAVKEDVVVASVEPEQAIEAVGEISQVTDMKWSNRGKYTGKAMATETGELVPHGDGRIIYPRGGFVEGTFINGLLNGKGRVLLPGRINEVGDFKDDNLDGDGRRVRPDKIVEEGKFTNGFLNGKGVRIYTDGKKEEGIFQLGEFIEPSEGEADATSAEDYEVGFDEPEAVEDTSQEVHVPDFGVVAKEEEEDHEVSFADSGAIEDTNPEVTPIQGKETRDELGQEIKDFFKSKNLKVSFDPYCALEKIKTLKEKQEELFTKVIEPLGSELVRKVRFIIGATMYIRSHKEIIINLNDLNDLDALNKKLREMINLHNKGAEAKPVEVVASDGLEKVVDFEFEFSKKYTGEVKINEHGKKVPHGQGRMEYWGSVFEGSFENGKLNGSGKITDSNGIIADGEFKNGRLQGQGKVIAKDGSIMAEGEFVDGVIFYGGKKVYQAGVVVEGDFKNDSLEGHGKIIYPDGRVSVGEFKNGKFNGHCRVELDFGSVEEGEFVNDRLHGDGKRSYFGGVSEGLFEKGRFVKGKFSHLGNVEEGEFKDHFDGPLLHGQGKRINKDGTVEEGRFEDGKLVESAVATMPVVGAGEPVVSTRDRDVLPPLPPSFPPVPDEKERRKMPDAIWPGVPVLYDENTMGKPENKFKRDWLEEAIKMLGESNRLFVFADSLFKLGYTELKTRTENLISILDGSNCKGKVGLIGEKGHNMIHRGNIQLNIEEDGWQDRLKEMLNSQNKMAEVRNLIKIDDLRLFIYRDSTFELDITELTARISTLKQIIDRAAYKGEVGLTSKNFPTMINNGGIQLNIEEDGWQDRLKEMLENEYFKEKTFANETLSDESQFTGDGFIYNGKLKWGRGLLKGDDYTCEGNFINGKLNGQGEKRLANGKIMKGGFDNDYFVKGFVANIPFRTKVPVLGSVRGEYTGEAVADENRIIPNGEGVLKRKLLRDLSGTWENGEFVSKGKVDTSELEKRHIETGSIDAGEPVVEEEKGQIPDLLLSSGARYTGEVKMDDSGIKVPHGKGKMTYPDGRIEEGRFENGVWMEPSVDVTSDKEKGLSLTEKFRLAKEELVKAIMDKTKSVRPEQKNYDRAMAELLAEQNRNAEQVFNFLREQQNQIDIELQGKFMKGEGGFEKFGIGWQKVWRKMGDLNLYNLINRDKKPESEVEVNSGKLRKIGRFLGKTASVRGLISYGLLGAGLVTGREEFLNARSFMAGTGAGMASRDIMDRVGKARMQKEIRIYESEAEAKRVFDLNYKGKSDKKDKELQKWLGSVKVLSELESLYDRLDEIENGIQRYQGYALINKIDLNKDAEYSRLLDLRMKLREQREREVLTEVGLDLGSEVPVDKINELLAELKVESSLKLANAIDKSKVGRWKKRIGSFAIGLGMGAFVRFKVAKIIMDETGMTEKIGKALGWLKGLFWSEDVSQEMVAGTVEVPDVHETTGADLPQEVPPTPKAEPVVPDEEAPRATVPKKVPSEVPTAKEPSEVPTEPEAPKARVPSETQTEPEAPKAREKVTPPAPEEAIPAPAVEQPRVLEVFGNPKFEADLQKAWNLNKETMAYLHRLTAQYPELNNEDALTRMFKVGKDWDIGKGVKSEFNEAFKGMISNPLEAAREADMIKFEEILKAGGDDRATEYLMGRNFNAHSLKNMGIEWDKDPDVVRQRVGDFVSEYKDKVIDVSEGGNKDATLMRKLGDALQHDENRDMYKYKEGGLFNKVKKLFIRRGLVLGMDETSSGDARKLVHSGFERYSGPKLVPEVEVEVQAPVARITADNFGIDRNTLVKVYDGPGGQLRTITLRPDEIIDIKPDGSGNQIATFVDADGKVNKAIFHLKGGVGDVPETIVLEGVQRVAESDLTQEEIAMALAKKAGALSPASEYNPGNLPTGTGRGVPKVVSGGGGGGGVPSEVKDLFEKGLAETKKQIGYALTDRKFSSDMYRTFFNTQGMPDEYEKFVKSYLTGHPNADLTKSKEAAKFIDSWRGYGKDKILELQNSSGNVPSDLTPEQKEMANYLENTESKASSETVVSDKTGTRVIKQEVGADVGKDKPEVPAVEETVPAEKPPAEVEAKPAVEENIATDTNKLIIGKVDANSMRRISVWDSSQDKAVDIKLPSNYEPQIVDGKLQIQINGEPVNGDLVRASVEGKEQWILRTEVGGQKDNILYAIDKLAKGNTDPIGKK